MYLDSKGLIVQQSGDGGDTLQREGFWYEGWSLNPWYPTIPGLVTYTMALGLLNTPEGFERSWQVPYNDPSDTSRDQLVSNIRACGYRRLNGPLGEIFWAIIKNFSRFPNNDIAFINDYGRFIRAYRFWLLWPLLLICDLAVLVNSIILLFYSMNLNNVGNDINHIGDLAQAQNVLATPVSWLARKIYKLRRGGPQYALDWYFRAASGGNPEFAELWAPIVKKF